MQEIHDIISFFSFRDVERCLSKFILHVGGCTIVKKQLDHFDISFTDGFVQGGTTHIARRIDVGPRTNQCSNLAYVSAARSDMKRPLVEIANLVYILKINLDECR